MRQQLLASLALAFGLLGLASVARAAEPKPYYVARFELKDADGIKPYSAGAQATFAPFGGRFIVRGGTVVSLEGESPGNRTAIIEFPSLERARI